ncbi:hypothetical protein F5877DRAFT_66730, partial [Lentinula edodes]
GGGSDLAASPAMVGHQFCEYLDPPPVLQFAGMRRFPQLVFISNPLENPTIGADADGTVLSEIKAVWITQEFIKALRDASLENGDLEAESLAKLFNPSILVLQSGHDQCQRDTQLKIIHKEHRVTSVYQFTLTQVWIRLPLAKILPRLREGKVDGGAWLIDAPKFAVFQNFTSASAPLPSTANPAPLNPSTLALSPAPPKHSLFKLTEDLQLGMRREGVRGWVGLRWMGRAVNVLGWDQDKKQEGREFEGEAEDGHEESHDSRESEKTSTSSYPYEEPKDIRMEPPTSMMLMLSPLLAALDLASGCQYQHFIPLRNRLSAQRSILPMIFLSIQVCNTRNLNDIYGSVTRNKFISAAAVSDAEQVQDSEDVAEEEIPSKMKRLVTHITGLSGSEAKDDVASAAIKPRSRMLVYALIEGGIGGRARCMVNNDTRERDKDRDIDRDVNQNVIDLMNKRWLSSKRILVQLRVALVHIHI